MIGRLTDRVAMQGIAAKVMADPDVPEVLKLVVSSPALTDPRPRPVLPESGRRVRVAALLICLTHIHVAELVLGGMDPPEAFQITYDWWFYYLMPVAYQASGGKSPAAMQPGDVFDLLAYARRGLWPLTPELQAGINEPEDAPKFDFEFMPDDRRRWTHRCFVQAAADNAALLAYDEAAERYTVPCPPDLADSLRWQLEMMRRYATGGGTLPECARGAYDQAAGRPRRRRAPADPDWLAGEIADALDGTWALLAAVLTQLPARRIRMDGR